MNIFFDGWDTVARTLIIGVLAYLALVVIVRASGKRMLSKWNAFDFIVTIAIGSSLATVLLSKDVSLVQGVLGFGILVGLQFCATWLAVRSRQAERLAKARPALLLYQGRYCHETMLRERVSESEVLATLRGEGISEVEQVGAVVLETDGSFSVVPSIEQAGTALADVDGYPDAGGAAPHLHR